MYDLEMIHSRDDLTLADVLADPMVRSMMDADKVDPDALQMALGEIARTIKPHASSRQKLRSFWPSTLPHEAKTGGSALGPRPPTDGKRA